MNYPLDLWSCIIMPFMTFSADLLNDPRFANCINAEGGMTESRAIADIVKCISFVGRPRYVIWIHLLSKIHFFNTNRILFIFSDSEKGTVSALKNLCALAVVMYWVLGSKWRSCDPYMPKTFIRKKVLIQLLWQLLLYHLAQLQIQTFPSCFFTGLSVSEVTVR